VPLHPLSVEHEIEEWGDGEASTTNRIRPDRSREFEGGGACIQDKKSPLDLMNRRSFTPRILSCMLKSSLITRGEGAEVAPC
jgi:hypothetical protein